MATLIQKGDLNTNDFTNDNTNAQQGVGVSRGPGSSVRIAIDERNPILGTTAPSTPPTTGQVWYVDQSTTPWNVYYWNGTTWNLTGDGTGLGGIAVQDEGLPLANQATGLNFVGAGVTAAGTGATKTVTVPGGVAVQDEGTDLAGRGQTFNFTGAGVTVTGAGDVKTVNIPGGGGGGGINGIAVQDEGIALAGDATGLNFVGAGVTAAGTGATKTVTVPGGVAVQDEGVALATQGQTLNFVGAGVTVTGTGATKTVTVPGGAATPVDNEGTQITPGVTRFNIVGDTVNAESTPAGVVTIQGLKLTKRGGLIERGANGSYTPAAAVAMIEVTCIGGGGGGIRFNPGQLAAYEGVTIPGGHGGGRSFRRIMNPTGTFAVVVGGAGAGLVTNWDNSGSINRFNLEAGNGGDSSFGLDRDEEFWVQALGGAGSSFPYRNYIQFALNGSPSYTTISGSVRTHLTPVSGVDPAAPAFRAYGDTMVAEINPPSDVAWWHNGNNNVGTFGSGGQAAGFFASGSYNVYTNNAPHYNPWGPMTFSAAQARGRGGPGWAMVGNPANQPTSNMNGFGGQVFIQEYEYAL